MRIYIFSFLFFSLLSSNVIAHEKTPISLQIIVEGQETQICFRSPVLRNGRPSMELTLPKSWLTKYNHKSEIENVEITDIRLQILDFNEPILFNRQDGVQSDLIINLNLNGQSSTEILKPETTSWQLHQATSLETFMEFMYLGFLHILIGADHLLFVLALFFLVSGRKLFWAISMFTIAHSLTLALSSFQIINLNVQIVEALIALSILLLGAELLKDKKDTRNLLAMTFVFGLLHGLGFANVLFDIGMPHSQIPISLLAFNLGVELGQIAFIFFIFLLYRVLSNIMSKRKVVIASSMVIGSLGAFWFIERTYSVFVP